MSNHANGKGQFASASIDLAKSQAITKTKATATIFVTATIVLIVGIIQDIRKGRAFSSDIIARRFLGFFVATLLLLMLAQPAPKLARAFAITMAVAVVVADSGKIFETVQQGLAPNIALDLVDAKNRTIPDRATVDNMSGGSGGSSWPNNMSGGSGGSSW